MSNKSSLINCQHCHTCGARLVLALDGEEWCPHCKQYWRYRSHGWSAKVAEPNSQQCPERLVRYNIRHITRAYCGEGEITNEL